MYHAPSKRKKRTQLAFIYFLMVLSVISIVVVLILITQGYRFNHFDGKLEQGGLVQFNSRPTGATVSVDGMALANRTASKITLSAGPHEVMISREGYTTWKKTVNVKPGSVLWLNYAQLLPVAPKVSTGATYTGVVTPLVAPNHKKLALFESSSQPVISMTTINTDKPETKKITIPAGVYTVPGEGATSDFSLMMWDANNRYLIVKHVYGDKTEYLSVDTDDLSHSRNITTSLGVDIANVRYSMANSGMAYILTMSHELRRADLEQSTITGPLVSNVAEFSMPDRDTVVYTTLADEKGARSVGYLTSGLSTAKQLKSFADISTAPLHISTGIYYSQRYVVISHGDTVDIYRGNLPSSDTKASIELKDVASYQIPGGADYLGLSPSENRFVYAAKGTKITTYDLELLHSSVVTLSTPLDREPEWMDGYHLINTGDGRGSFYDFDGTNAQVFAQTLVKQPAFMADGNTYLYYFAQTGLEIKLQRIRMIE